MKVFLSYSSLDKTFAGNIKKALEAFGIEVFVAHEDIEPSAQWVDTILAELNACDVLIPILTDNFHQSLWTDQEVGIAVAGTKLVIPVKITTDPYGFISNVQALKLDINNIDASIKELAEVIASKPVLGDSFRDCLVRKLRDSWSFDDARHNADLLVSFQGYTPRQLKDIISHTIANSQINRSFKARSALSNFIYTYKEVIDPQLFEAFLQAIK